MNGIAELTGRAGAARIWRGAPEWLVVLGVGLLGALLYLIPSVEHGIFYYVGDNPEAFVPLWHLFGEQLRDGQWLTMDPAGWYGGNYGAEAALSLWNPFALAQFLVVSWFDNLATATTVVVVGYLAVLCMGAFLLAREYGAHRVPAALVGVALPASGFTLYYEAAGWPAGLAAFTWVTWFWWAARRHSRGRLSPFVPFLLGLLAMSTGNPYAALGVLIVLLGIGVELVRQRRFGNLGHLAVLGACVGTSAALIFLPLIGALEVSSRQELAMIANDTFMVPDLGDIAASSAPTYLPSILNWNGALRENVPSTYFIWFVLPLLPWLRWRALRTTASGLTSVVSISAGYGILVLGPSNLWLFRWPIRLIEYLYLGLAVLFAVLLSTCLARDRFRERALISAAIVAGGAYLSFAVRPEYPRMHLLASVAVLLLVLAAVVVQHRYGWRLAGAVLLLGTIGVLTYQSARIPVRAPGQASVEPPSVVSRLRQGHGSYQGVVLQLASQAGVRTQDQDDGELLFGNLSLLPGPETINRYSGIGFAELTSALCMDYRGATCPDAYPRLWRAVPGTDVPLIDALRVRTLVLQNSLLPEVVRGPPRPGWRVLLQDGVRTVWLRENPLPYPGRVSAVSPGIQVRSASAAPQHERVEVRAPAGGGELIFARLAWPGYIAHVDGTPVEVEDGEAGLLTVAMPAGEHVLEIDYRTPGLRLGVLLLAGATAVALAQAVLWWVAGRRRNRAELAAGGDDEANDEITPALAHAGTEGNHDEGQH
ncbi:MAG: hypothetical protein ACJ72N_24950 [Labedaea sp.]